MPSGGCCTLNLFFADPDRRTKAGLHKLTPYDTCADKVAKRLNIDAAASQRRHQTRAIELQARCKLVYARGKSADAVEGVTSFLEKRDPEYPCKVSTDMPDVFPWWEEPEYK